MNNEAWSRSHHSAETVFENATGDGPKFKSHSLSGGERNRLFVREKGNFADIHQLSGLDMMGDGRSFALFDYNQDGWLDIALVNPGEPRLQVFKNEFSQWSGKPNKSLRIKLEGGNHSSSPSVEFSNRDGYGAEIEVHTTERASLYTHQASEGLSAQNSDWIHVGLNANETLKHIIVRWPSGKSSKIESPQAKSLIVREKEEAGASL